MVSWAAGFRWLASRFSCPAPPPRPLCTCAPAPVIVVHPPRIVPPTRTYPTILPVELPAPEFENTPIPAPIVLWFLFGALAVAFAIRYIHGTFRKSAPPVTKLAIAYSIISVTIALVNVFGYGCYLFGCWPLGSRPSPFEPGALANTASIPHIDWREAWIMKNFAPSNLLRCGTDTLVFIPRFFAFIAKLRPHKWPMCVIKPLFAWLTRGLVPIELSFIGLTIFSLLTLAYYLSQAPERDITLWEDTIKAEELDKRSKKKEEKKLRKILRRIQKLRKKLKGRRRVALEILEQRQRKYIKLFREFYDKLVLQRSVESRQTKIAVEDQDRALRVVDYLHTQLDQLRESTDDTIAQLEREKSGLESNIEKLASWLNEADVNLRREKFETADERTIRENYIKDWTHTRQNLLGVIDGTDPDRSKIIMLREILLGRRVGDGAQAGTSKSKGKSKAQGPVP